jgi:hypothetical protein
LRDCISVSTAKQDPLKIGVHRRPSAVNLLFPN